MKRIEFGELRIGETARKHIQDCLNNNWISMGPKVELLEKEFAKLMGTQYAVALSSGTAAITAMTLALPEIAHKTVIRGKSNVICPALGFIANTTGIISGLLRPKWVDIKPETLNINEDLVEEAIDDDTVAIYCIGTMGQPSEMDKLKAIADKHGLILFEDACENYGSEFKNQPSHSYAIGGCSSFFTAHLVNGAEGSCLFTDNEKLADLITSIRSHGRIGKSAYFDHCRFGSNFKLNDLCASVALEGVEQFYENIQERKYIWKDLVNHCKKYKGVAWFSDEPSHVKVMPHGFSITLKPEAISVNNHIGALKSTFDKYNIHHKRNFGLNCSHAAVKEWIPTDNWINEKYPQALWCGNNGIHIGTHRFYLASDVLRIKTAIDEFFDSYYF